MIRRLQGLVNLHIWAATILVTGYFLALVLFVPYFWPRIDLSESGKLYAVPVLLGMLVSSRYWHRLSYKFHAISWVDAASIAARQMLIVALISFGLIVATKDRSISRLFLGGFLISGWFGLVVINRLLPASLAKLAFHRAHQVPAVFVGSPQTMGELKSWIVQRESLGVSIVGVVCDQPDGEIPGVDLPWLGSVQQLPQIIEEREIGQVILTELPQDPKLTLFFLETCQSSGCRFLIRQNWWDRLPVPMTPVLEGNNFFLTLNDEPLEDPLNRALKRVFDICVSLPVVVLVLPPLCLVVALAQRIQAPGPLLFQRLRGGHRRRAFGMLKFRSMYVRPPDAAAEARQATAGDVRIYPFGAFLRRTSLDEFPQFLNVLLGQMSIVGPRPHLPIHDQEFSLLEKAYRTRHLVKPGLTGLAQVSGYRGEITDALALRRRIGLDLDYIARWSIWLDIQITIRTIVQIFRPPRSAQ